MIENGGKGFLNTMVSVNVRARARAKEHDDENDDDTMRQRWWNDRDKDNDEDKGNPWRATTKAWARERVQMTLVFKVRMSA